MVGVVPGSARGGWPGGRPLARRGVCCFFGLVPEFPLPLVIIGTLPRLRRERKPSSQRFIVAPPYEHDAAVPQLHAAACRAATTHAASAAACAASRRRRQTGRAPACRGIGTETGYTAPLPDLAPVTSDMQARRHCRVGAAQFLGHVRSTLSPIEWFGARNGVWDPDDERRTAQSVCPFDESPNRRFVRSVEDQRSKQLRLSAA
jgi:hypothetical protein